MSRIKNVDVLNGPLFSSIIRFGVPLLFVALIQSLFNAMDLMVLGQMASTDAVAAVGATSTIVNLIVTVSIGISAGAKIVLARLIGEGVSKRTQENIFTSMITALALGIITAIIGIAFAPYFLELTKCPETIRNDARSYISLYFSAAPAIMIYNFGSNIIQVSGDSQRPLYYMIFAGLLNVVMNVILCLIMPQKVAAVAIATAASQILGAILVFRRLTVINGDCRFSIKSGKWRWRSFKKIMANGLPIGLSSSLYPLASLQIQSALNSYGSAAIAGSSAATNIEGVECAISATPWHSTVGVFVGQNVGADNKKRVKQSILACTAISISFSIILSAFAFLFAKPLLALFGSTDEAIYYGRIRMMYTVVPYAVACLNGILSNVIQAFGYSMFSTINSIISVFIFRVVWMRYIYPLAQNFHTLILCFLVSWILVALFNLGFFFYLYFRKFKADKLKKMG